MAKRELSNTLRNLKFMQRASRREEKSKKEEELKPDGNFPSSGALKKCLVMVEGDPHPGAIKGRMSFQSFNPSVDKLNEEAPNLCQPEASALCSGNPNGRIADRENGSTHDVTEKSNNNANREFKRKQAEVVSETQYANKTQKNVQHDQESSPNSSSSSHRQQKRERLDWSVLRPPKGQKRGD
ncbi:Mediator of RNA polymerase II transcription subunit like [Actinidia chinensis var. chinensis]|uniref:Mediator of RNA polymerase II transcription subunit like n=1 Tax=Actinidia chinensis var. chinensis TaxID=1590841 RepID=A0A2R6PPX9_ACTCC|nr:Mediator of RNA polymerase II transcription subunit like [Actinidia chinensis var. chinensis]